MKHTDGLDHRDLHLLVQRSCALLWVNAPKDGTPYMGAFSGGKDSIVIKELARIAKVPVEWHYQVTTIDPPELVQFIKRKHSDVHWDHPKHGNFFHRMLVRGFPTRRHRWCCADYKERDYPGSSLIIGVRIAESYNRRNNWQSCVSVKPKRSSIFVAPIRLWPDAAVWEFIRKQHLDYCFLYDEGWLRLGCIGCPMNSYATRQAGFDRWPRYEAAWKRAFQRLWLKKSGSINRNREEWWGSKMCDSWEELFDWWNGGQKNIVKWRQERGLRVKWARPAVEKGKSC